MNEALPLSPARPRALPDLRALEAFVCVCEAGSMALAAQRLGLSQSAVSQAVRTLELAHGLSLFDRDVRPARPTRAGRALLELAGALLGQARQVGPLLRQQVQQEHAQLRLGCVDSFAATVGPELVRALSGRTRELQLLSGLTPALNAQLQARELDLVVCTEPPDDDERLSRQPLFAESWVLVLPRRGDWRGPDAPTVPALQAWVAGLGAAGTGHALPLIRYSQRSRIGQQVERWLRHVGLVLPRRFEFDATDPLLSLVAAGLGWAVCTPLCLWQSRAWLDQVQVLPLPATRLGQREFFLLSHRDEWPALATELLGLGRRVLQHDTWPALQRLLPQLPADAIRLPPDPVSSSPAA